MHRNRINGNPIEWKQRTIKLGVRLDVRLRFNKYLDDLRRQSALKIKQLHPILKSNKMSPFLSTKVYKIYVRPISTYACPAWYPLL